MKKQTGSTLLIILLFVFIVATFYVVTSLLPQYLKEQSVDKTTAVVVGLKKEILKSYTNKATPEELIKSLNPEIKKEGKIYLKEIESNISLSGMNATYPMSIITIENMPQDLCKPLVMKLYSQFEQIIPYSQKGGVGTCYSWVKAKKPPIEKVLQSCITYEHNRKIWLSLLVQNNDNGACNIPD